jgi:tetraacyldisaccharide 4'-kinase
LLKLLRIILSPAYLVYGMAVKLRNYMFDKGIFKSIKVGTKIISIGNITVGGSGKTPAVAYVTNYIKSLGKKVSILSRGYGRSTKGYLTVSDGDRILTRVTEAGDEIYLLSSECKVPTAVSENRVEGAERLIKDFPLDVIVLDDAFQHRWIHRDLDILIFDQMFLENLKITEQKLLPLGLMREPFTAIQRAGLIVINRKFSDKRSIPPKLEKYFADKKVVTAYYSVTGIIDLKNQQEYGLDEFSGQKSLVVCGVAKPQSFLKLLENNNIDITNKIIFKDHKDYSNKEVQSIRRSFYETNSYSVLTTEKDAVKLIQYKRELDDIDIFYLKIELILDDPEFFNNEIDKVIIQ